MFPPESSAQSNSIKIPFNVIYSGVIKLQSLLETRPTNTLHFMTCGKIVINKYKNLKARGKFYGFRLLLVGDIKLETYPVICDLWKILVLLFSG